MKQTSIRGWFLILCSLVSLGSVSSCSRRLANDGNLYAIVHTRDDLLDLNRVLRLYSNDLQAGRTNFNSWVDRFDLSPRALFHLLSENPVGEDSYLMFTISYHRWMRARSIVDRWGNGFNHRISARKHVELNGTLFYSITVLFWSNGPNGQDEQGKGDDLVGNACEIVLPEEKMSSLGTN